MTETLKKVLSASTCHFLYWSNNVENLHKYSLVLFRRPELSSKVQAFVKSYETLRQYHILSDILRILESTPVDQVLSLYCRWSVSLHVCFFLSCNALVPKTSPTIWCRCLTENANDVILIAWEFQAIQWLWDIEEFYKQYLNSIYILNSGCPGAFCYCGFQWMHALIGCQIINLQFGNGKLMLWHT